MIISFTVSGQREEYLRRSLESWAQARGIEGVELLFCVEPERSFPVQEFNRWVGNNFPCKFRVVTNPERLGILANTRQAFELAFQLGADFAVLAEEDIVVSTDVISYLDWGRQHGDQYTTAVCAHVKDSTGGTPDQVTRVSWFSPLICGTWPAQWEAFIGPTWGGPLPDARGNAAPDAWDANLRNRIHETGRNAIFPVLSRANHIGEQSTWLPPGIATYLYPAGTSEAFQRDYGVVPEYREVGFDDVPRLIV